METCESPEGADETAREDAPVTEPEQREATPELESRQRRAEMVRGTTERRDFSSTMECRTLDDGTLRMAGYASITEHPYEIGDPKRGGFIETVRRNSFKRTLGESPDCVLVTNHGEGGGLPLARTKNGSLALSEDSRGLHWQADLDPEDPASKVLARKVEQGLLDQCSFAFRVTDDAWNEDFTERTIKGVSLHGGDVSVVNYGANPATSVSTLRSDDGTVELRAGKTISAANAAQLTSVLNLIATADDAVDRAQPMLAEILGVPNPDADDEPDADEAERAAEPPPETARVIVMPDFRERERLAALRRAR